MDPRITRIFTDQTIKNVLRKLIEKTVHQHFFLISEELLK
jgi:hypothetical protein